MAYSEAKLKISGVPFWIGKLPDKCLLIEFTVCFTETHSDQPD
jgi:hypothetical protein